MLGSHEKARYSTSVPLLRLAKVVSMTMGHLRESDLLSGNMGVDHAIWGVWDTG